ncbi:putative baseplate assembly protein [Paraburkholderia sp. BCC1886]|uniref:putative baseplate assembly protein n=1 Tax=Paraburkholderia sp. BCC1886 TaxID=2562670 RepID=UPI00118425F9|nr:putative baseplate assembly protein [Paraburkholderia sp. BCC1886]
MDALHPLVEDDRQRRIDARRKGLNGIDYIEVGDDPRQLEVVFFLAKPLSLNAANCTIEGGARIRGIRVTGVHDPEDSAPGAGRLILTVDRRGDFSVYTLALDGVEGFDPHYTRCTFSFRTAEPRALDCVSAPTLTADVLPAPEIDYLAKDYASLRQLIVNRLALTMPEWHEAHAPDEGVALVELLAYVGDYLSYYQDAVATEAYLNTARQRISVRRHARLVDYAVHEGCNARTWVCMEVDVAALRLVPDECRFVTDCHTAMPDVAAVLGPNALTNVPASQYQAFSVMTGTATSTPTSKPMEARAAHNRISFHAWGARQYVLPEGATAATLCDAWATDDAPDQDTARTQIQTHTNPRKRALADLQAGSFMLIEAVRNPVTGASDEADPAHRQVVRLTRVEPGIDPVYDKPVLHVEWAADDALRFPLVVAMIGPAPDCRYLGPATDTEAAADVSVARANVWLVDHGVRFQEDVAGQVGIVATTAGCEDENVPAETLTTSAKFAPTLRQPDLVFSVPLPPDAVASQLLTQAPRDARAALMLWSIPGVPDGSRPLFTFADLDAPANLIVALKAKLLAQVDGPPDARHRVADPLLDRLSRAARAALSGYDAHVAPPAALVQTFRTELAGLVTAWRGETDLLSSGPDDFDYVVEIDDGRIAHLRFGDGKNGARPAAGSVFQAAYRYAAPLAGNVGSGTIMHLQMLRGELAGGVVRVWNPLAAQGGTAPEALADVRANAPTAFLNTIERAVTADDYATLAARHPGVRRAAATLRWTGSAYVMQVAVAPYGGETVNAALLADITRFLERYRRIGHDVEVTTAAYVSLDIGIEVHIGPDYLRGHVEAALLDAFGTGLHRSATRGLFAPDNLSFGEDIYLSRLIATAQSVEGVVNIVVTRFERQYVPSREAIDSGVLVLGPQEIARVDNDPDFPEHGRLGFRMRGGR